MLYIFLKLEEGGIFADIDQSSEEDVHLASFQGGDFILFQSFKKQLTFFYCKVLKAAHLFYCEGCGIAEPLERV